VGKYGLFFYHQMSPHFLNLRNKSVTELVNKNIVGSISHLQKICGL